MIDLLVDDRAARRSLQGQVARLERELRAVAAGVFPPIAVDPGEAPPEDDLGALERRRDDLADHVLRARVAVRERRARQAQARRLLEDMIANPRAHKWARVSGADLGLRVCAYQVRPRRGLLGMAMGWWEVKLSSGCPLAAHPSLRRPAT